MQEGRYYIAPSRMRSVMRLMDTRLAERITLPDLAEAANLSVFYFSRMFKKSVGTSPYRYLIDRRCHRACELLVRTDAGIVEIALACGFASQQHLTWAFRRYLGTTPAEYRRRSGGLQQ